MNERRKEKENSYGENESKIRWEVGKKAGIKKKKKEENVRGVGEEKKKEQEN